MEELRIRGNRNKKRIKIFIYILSILLPMVIMILGLMTLNITPFGERTIAISDGLTYLNSIASYKRLLQGKEDWLYSLKNGIGYNNWSNMAWGGFNLISVISLFSNLETIPDCYTWITVFSLAVSGLTMYILLSHLYGYGSTLLIFSTSYSLIGFSVANCYQTGFFTGVYILPLMVLGLHRLINGESPALYILSLGYCILTNFYFGFQLCVASVVFLVAYMAENWTEIKEKAKGLVFRYSISSIISGLLGAVVWLPTLKAYSDGGRLDQTVSEEFTFDENMPFIRIFSKLFTGANSTSELIDGLPNIFCGILVLALVFLFFLDKKVEKKHKISTAAVIGFYMLSFYIVVFTLLMHGGTHTNWFNYRYSYVFSFILIYIAAEEYRNRKDFLTSDIKKVWVILGISAILIFSTEYEYISGGDVLIDFAILALMTLLLHLYKKYPHKISKRIAGVILTLLVSVNLYANYTISIDKMMESSTDLALYKNDIMLAGSLTEGIANYDSTLYRMENEYSRTGTCDCDNQLYGYNGIGGWGPCIRMFVHKQLSKLGINWFDMRHYYSDGIPAATDALLGLKYVISTRDLEEEKDYEKKISVNEGEVSIFQSPYNLNLAVLTEKDIKETELENDIFDNLNKVWKDMTGGSRNVFTEEKNIVFTLHNNVEVQDITSDELKISTSISQTKTEAEETDEEPITYIEFTFKAQQDGPVYYFDTSVPDSENGSEYAAVRYVGNYEKGDTVNGKISIMDQFLTKKKFTSECQKYTFAYANNEVLQEYANMLRERVLTVEKETDSVLQGSFTAEKGQSILFTLPWDEGWTCYIDGEKAEIKKVWDLFMAVDAPEGTHTYELQFFPAWMNYGIMISSASVIGLIVFLIADRKKQNIRKKNSVYNCQMADAAETRVTTQ